MKKKNVLTTLLSLVVRNLELILDIHTKRSYSKLAQNHQNLLENYQ